MIKASDQHPTKILSDETAHFNYGYELTEKANPYCPPLKGVLIVHRARLDESGEHEASIDAGVYGSQTQDGRLH